MKIILSIPLVAAPIAYIVRGGPGIGAAADYRVGALVGMATGVIVSLLLLMRLWMGPRMTQELRAYPLHYGGPLMLVAGAVFLVGKADGDPAAGMTRPQAEFVAGFRDGCISRQGLPARFCECAARELVSREQIVTHEDVESFVRRVQPALRTGRRADVPASVRRAMLDCARLSSG